MRPLPPRGLIVSCYLESMRGCEREFIASAAHLPQVIALRVEGLDNIGWARMVAPEMFIIGLVKEHNGFYNEITPDIELDGKRIIAHGADMVATSNVFSWMTMGHNVTIHGLSISFRMMFDLDAGGIEVLCRPSVLEDWEKNVLKREISHDNIVLATTFESKAFELVKLLKEHYPQSKVNLEGGIETAEEIQRGFDAGADYVTIGKAINDPPTIIERLMDGVDIPAPAENSTNSTNSAKVQDTRVTTKLIGRSLVWDANKR